MRTVDGMGRHAHRQRHTYGPHKLTPGVRGRVAVYAKRIPPGTNSRALALPWQQKNMVSGEDFPSNTKISVFPGENCNFHATQNTSRKHCQTRAKQQDSRDFYPKSDENTLGNTCLLNANSEPRESEFSSRNTPFPMLPKTHSETTAIHDSNL